MTVRLFDAHDGSWQGTPGLLGSTTEYANAFTLSEDQYLRDLSWYRNAVGGAGPTTLRVWRASTGAVVYSAAVVPDNNTVGWQRHTVTEQVLLLSGIEYRVSHCLPASSNTMLTYDSGARPTPPSPLAYAAVARRHNVGSCNFPNTDGGTDFYESVDVGVDPDPPDFSEPLTEASIENALIRWFDSGVDNTRTAELPWLTKVVIDAINTKVEALGTDVDLLEARVGVSGVLTVLGELAKLAGMEALLTTVDNVVDSIFAKLTGPLDVQDGLTEINLIRANQTQEINRDRASIFNATLFAPGVGVSGVGSHDVLVPADAYVFQIDNAAALRSFSVVNGDPTPRHIGSLTPIDGPALGAYTPIIWATHYLRIPGTTMQGVRVLVDPVIEWTITPYQYDPA